MHCLTITMYVDMCYIYNVMHTHITPALVIHYYIITVVHKLIKI